MNRLAPVLRDLTAAAGLALIVAGVAGWSRPAAMIAAGVIAVAVVYLYSIASQEDRADDR